jgi:phytoene dehydrogenase-like protein
VDFIQSHGGEIRTSAPVTAINIEKHTVSTPHHREIGYRQLLWAADQKALYENVEPQSISNPKVRTAIDQQKSLLSDLKGNDSVLSLFAATNLSKAYFEQISTGHFFYTPSREGISKAGTLPAEPTWEQIAAWLARFFALTTYEISIPVLRDEALAPPGKTGLILSVLFDYHLTRYIDEKGWTALFKELTADLMIATLEKSIYPGLAAAIEDRLVATPLTIQQRNGSTDGAITGWSFTNHPIPAENRLVKIANSAKTPLPDVFQAGQWTYSPSGLPVALIPGKVAADAIHKKLK